jgi:hypothetical protein
MGFPQARRSSVTDRTEEFRTAAAEVSRIVRAIVRGHLAVGSAQAESLILQAMQVAYGHGRCDAIAGLDIDKVFDAAFPEGVVLR